MHRALLILTCLISLVLIGCRDYRGYEGGKYDIPTYPGGGYGGGGYYPAPDDDGPSWVYDVIGEWEGFLWETYRSDGMPYSKRRIAMRCVYSGQHEWVKVDLLVDGRPAASSTARVESGGYMRFHSYRSGIELEFVGRFRNDRATGEIRLEWDEKVEIPYGGKVEMHHVYLRGDFDLGRVRGAHWAAAWELFDTYGDGVWDLPEEVWQAATLEGLAHLATIEETDLLQIAE